MPATFKTRNDLVNEALMNLGILAAGQTAAAEDFEAVDGKVEQLIAWLEAAQIIDIDDLDDIGVPVEWFNPLAVLLAEESALMFGLPGVPASPSAPSPAQAAIDRLRLASYARPTFERQKTEYF